jgi:hypothetical protein
MNKLRTIAIEERRQLITLGLAVIVFLMSLVALQIRDRSSTLNRIADANRAGTSQGIGQASSPMVLEESPERSGNRALALAAAAASVPR